VEEQDPRGKKKIDFRRRAIGTKKRESQKSISRPGRTSRKEAKKKRTWGGTKKTHIPPGL